MSRTRRYQESRGIRGPAWVNTTPDDGSPPRAGVRYCLRDVLAWIVERNSQYATTTNARRAKPAGLLSEAEILLRTRPFNGRLRGIYFLIRDRRIVYVGQSVNAIGRVAEHAKTKRFDSWAFIPCRLRDLNSLEAAYIAALLPPLNRDFATRFRKHVLIQQMNEQAMGLGV